MKKIYRFVVFILACMWMMGVTVSAETAGKAQEQISNLVIFVEFSDTPTEDGLTAGYTYGAISNDEVAKKAYHIYLNESYDYSMTAYMNAISYGQLKVVCYVPQLSGEGDSSKITTVRLNNPHDYYVEQSKETNLVSDVLAAIKNDPELLQKLSGLDLDLNGDGNVDNLTLVCAAGTDSSVEFTTHKSDYWGTQDDALNGKYVNHLNVISAVSAFIGLEGNSGVLCHEFMHTLGYPDLYKNGNSQECPVSSWDIMASSPTKMPYPLAYMRMHVSGWLNIKTITEDTDLTLVPATQAHGDQAFILKSPRSDKEFFVIEYRKKPNTMMVGAKVSPYDQLIPGSGLVIYRIDTTQESLSNHINERNGVYVFRKGLTSESMASSGDLMSQSYFSATDDGNGIRTEFGSTDPDATIVDGALVFSDGTNSGIRISNIGEAKDTISCHVEFAQIDESSLWKQITGELGSKVSNKVVLEKTADGSIYAAVADRNAHTISLYSYNGNAWQKKPGEITDYNLDGFQLKACDNDLYILYGNSLTACAGCLKRYDQNTWKTVLNLKDYSGDDMDLSTGNGQIFVSYVVDNKVYLVSSGLDGSDKTEMVVAQGDYANVTLCNVGNDAYLSVRAWRNNNEIHSFKISGSSVNAIGTVAGLSTMQLVSDGQNVYMIGNSSEGNVIYRLETEGFQRFGTAIPGGSAAVSGLVVEKGTLYALVSKSVANNVYAIQVYGYDEASGTWKQEGNNLSTGDVMEASGVICDSVMYVGLSTSDGSGILRPQIFMKKITLGNVPTEPSTPTDPDEPSQPSTPTDPDEPSQPTTPTNPDEPSQPSTPTDPDEPSQPSTPTTPAEPGEPTGPTSYLTKTGIDGFVTRLYNVALLREADQDGYQNWKRLLQNGTYTGAQVSYGFIFSREMENRNLSDRAFINMMYRVFLDREPDAGGRDHWIQYLAGGVSREYIFYGFVESSEFRQICNSYGIRAGSFSPQQGRDLNAGATFFVSRIYTKALDRQYDVDGLNHWGNEIASGKLTPKQVAMLFFHSQEFLNKNLDDEEYIKRLYRTFLNRELDESGFAYWKNELRTGKSRDKVLEGFADSTEFRKIMSEYGL